jgi:hypothetical protein
MTAYLFLYIAGNLFVVLLCDHRMMKITLWLLNRKPACRQAGPRRRQGRVEVEVGLRDVMVNLSKKKILSSLE